MMKEVLFMENNKEIVEHYYQVSKNLQKATKEVSKLSLEEKNRLLEISILGHKRKVLKEGSKTRIDN